MDQICLLQYSFYCLSQDEPEKPTPKKQKVANSGKGAAKATPSKKAASRKATKPSKETPAKGAAKKQPVKGKGNGTTKKTKKAQRVTSDSEESEGEESESELSGQEVCFCSLCCTRLAEDWTFLLRLPNRACNSFDASFKSCQCSKDAMQEGDDASDFEVDVDTEGEVTPAKKKAKYGPCACHASKGFRFRTWHCPKQIRMQEELLQCLSSF